MVGTRLKSAIRYQLIQKNLTYALVYYGIYGMTSLRKKPNASSFRAIPYWGLIGVGVFSAAFHASLKYHTQMRKSINKNINAYASPNMANLFDHDDQWTTFPCT